MEKRNAYINIFRTFFVSFILAGGAIAFSSDVSEIALQPLEDMIEKVNMIAKNPLASRDI